LLDPITFYLGPNEASPVHYAWKDINGDGMVDLILHFRIRDTGIECGDTSTILKGETVDGELIEGSDFISTVNCRRERTFKKHHNRILKHHR
ncbi:MAG TPA: hypothetical protein VHO84_03030, partial [Syntrophorhabdaceae bacterium]|nr:hypothetical protein [Syntrophorhabdaceae bacterium]